MVFFNRVYLLTCSYIQSNFVTNKRQGSGFYGLSKQLEMIQLGIVMIFLVMPPHYDGKKLSKTKTFNHLQLLTCRCRARLSEIQLHTYEYSTSLCPIMKPLLHLL